ncbi:MAG: dephospho-CoA kinase [Eubacteriales bacterium]
MKILGITGGVGSGKSTVLQYLSTKENIVVYEADKIAFELQQHGSECYDKIIKQFGTHLLLEDKSINRKKLGEIVFNDTKQLELLNSIVHPAVRSKIEEVIKSEFENATSILVLEAAILLESNYQILCDEVWYIYCKKEVRVKRLQESRNYTIDTIENITQKQLTDDEFRSKCDITIDNSDSAETLYQNIETHLQNLLS